MEIQPGDVYETSADINKIKNLTGFKPTTSIEEGIPKFINWYNQFHN